MHGAHESASSPTEFEERLGEHLDRRRPVLIARHGLDVGGDLCAEVASYAWEHRERLAVIENPAGYLFRVSQSRARKYRRWRQTAELPAERPQREPSPDTDADIGLDRALARLSRDERTVVVLVHAYGNSYQEVADLLGISHTAVRNRLHRGMARLRRILGEP